MYHEALQASRLDLQNQRQSLGQLREDRTRWRFFYGEVAAAAIIGLGEISLAVLRLKVSGGFNDTFRWKAVKAGWRLAESVAGIGAAVLKDRQMSYQIDDAESQLDWDSRQIGRVERLMDDEFLSIYRDYPLAPGG